MLYAIQIYLFILGRIQPIFVLFCLTRYIWKMDTKNPAKGPDQINHWEGVLNNDERDDFKGEEPYLSQILFFIKNWPWDLFG